MTDTQLSQALRAARTSSGLAQGEAADRIDVSRAWLASLEVGRITRPDGERLKRLATLYNVDPNVFLKMAGYDTDGSTMPVRKLSDLALELYTKAKEAEASAG